jgi:hypothetical protein
MEITRVSPQAFDAHFTDAPCFSRGAFNGLNTDLCDDLHCLLFRDSKIRLGLIVGRREDTLYSPFSAPFGSFVTTDSKIQVAYIEEAVGLLEAYAMQNGIKRVEMVLPPLFYDTAFLTKLTQVLHRQSWNMQDIDLNFYVDLQNTTEANRFGMTYSAQKNLKTALKHPFNLIKSQSMENLSLAYEIIAANRSAKEYALSLSKKRLLATAAVVSMDNFLLELEGQYVASAIVYQVTPAIPLVVYWGDLPGYESFRTMNYLTQGVIDSYRKEGFNILDTGTAMLGNKPNPGLCTFKESIGCTILPRCTFVKHIS